MKDKTVDTFGLLKSFINKIIGRLDVGPTQNLVGLVKFSDTATTVFSLRTYASYSKAEIYKAVDSMDSNDQNTNTALGLRSVFRQTNIWYSLLAETHFKCAISIQTAGSASAAPVCVLIVLEVLMAVVQSI